LVISSEHIGNGTGGRLERVSVLMAAVKVLVNHLDPQLVTTVGIVIAKDEILCGE
jgi:hypothetical protein